MRATAGVAEVGSEAYGLAERPALADGDLVTLLDTESRRDVCGEVLVPLLVAGVLGDEVEVLAADDQGAVHLGGDDGAGQDTAADRDEAGEGALLVCAKKQMSVYVLRIPLLLMSCVLCCLSQCQDL